MNQPYIKEFIEERDLTVYLVMDVSASNEFGSKKSKKESAIEMAASLIFAALRNNDRVGLVLFTKEIEKFIPPRKGKRHMLKLIREMAYFEPKNKETVVKPTLRFLSKLIKKRSIVFIISDFFTDEKYEKELKLLRNKHDVIAINMHDIREQVIPDVGYIELEDEETGEQILVDTSDKEFRRNYVSYVNDRNNRLNKMFQKLRIDMIQLKSDEPFDIPLRKFFRMREKRLRV
jgi:uncharacterized protein (DUF58 family)